jgi:hypothetical protein
LDIDIPLFFKEKSVEPQVPTAAIPHGPGRIDQSAPAALARAWCQRKTTLECRLCEYWVTGPARAGI